MSKRKTLLSSPAELKARQSRFSQQCTHRTLTRVYDSSKSQRCTICHKIPDLGYLYRCTAETNGILPISEFVDEDLSMDLGTLKVNHEASNDFSFFGSPPASDAFPASNTIHFGETSDSDIATDDILARAFTGKRKFEAAFPPVPVPECELKICQTCRPGFKDRAWQSIDQIASGRADVPLQFEFENRRVSNADVVRGLKPFGSLSGKKGDGSRVMQWQGKPAQAEDDVHNQSTDDEAIRQVTTAGTQSPLKSVKKRPVPHVDDSSDADDEKGFTADTKSESDSSTTDDGAHSASHSEIEDILTPHNPRRSIGRLSFSERPMTPPDLENMRQPGHGGTLRRSVRGNQCDQGAKQLDQSDTMKPQISRPYNGRFEID